jgi:hypothetical protein
MAGDALDPHTVRSRSRLSKLCIQLGIDLTGHPHHDASSLLSLLLVRSSTQWDLTNWTRRCTSDFDVALIAHHTERHVECLHNLNDLLPRPAGGEHPVDVNQALSNANLELRFYGPILMTGSASDENNPIHLWNGMCASPCAFTLRDKGNFADFTGLARIKVVTKTSGFHKVNPIVKLVDGTMLIGDDLRRGRAVTNDEDVIPERQTALHAIVP